jgi:hypothetical protein
MKEVKTLEQYLSEQKDDKLIEIQTEVLSGIVPKKGSAHTMCREVNKLIDQGNLKINQFTYRKVYLPSLAKAVDRELSRRYVQFVVNGVQLQFERTR